MDQKEISRVKYKQDKLTKQKDMDYNVDGREVLKTLYGIEIGEDADALKDPEGNDRPLLEVIKEHQQQKLNQITETYKSEKDSQYKRGRRETAEEFEKKLRKQHGITDSSLKGDALLEEIANRIQTKQNEFAEAMKNSDLSEEQIKASKVYQDLQIEKESALAEVNSKWEEKLKETKQEFTKQQTEKKMLEILSGYLQSDKLAISEDQEVNNVRRNNFIREVMNQNYRFDDNGNVVLLNADGSLKKDQLENAVSFDEFVNKALKNHIGFKVSKVQTPGTPDPTGNNTGWKGKIPTNDEEFMQMYSDPANKEHQSAIAKAYKESKFIKR